MTCPCKQLPLRLSTFTAAEYGDLQSISKSFAEGRVHRTDAGGYTPLHFAAQHGHVAATAFLLRRGANVDAEECGASPLHRASFSGAVTTMRLLIDAKANLLSKDVSFGDYMTPLHKATAGGRHLAVQLLIDALRCREQLKEALAITDSNGKTPLQVGVELQPFQKEEREKVQRWDEIAGETADWDKCVFLLQSCTDNSSISISSSSMSALPQHLRDNAAFCLDCSEGCLTASWETAFRVTLSTSVSSQHQSNSLSRDHDNALAGATAVKSLDIPATPLHLRQENSSGNASDDLPRGRMCVACGKTCFALFRNKGGSGLVCRACSCSKG